MVYLGLHGIDGPFLVSLPIKNGDFSMAMLNNQRVSMMGFKRTIEWQSQQCFNRF